MDMQAADLDELTNRLGGDEACLAELIDIFLEDTRARAEEIRSEAANLTGLRRAAHTIKGAAGNLCAYRASEAASRLEAAAALGDAGAVSAARLVLLIEMDRLIVQLAERRDLRRREQAAL